MVKGGYVLVSYLMVEGIDSYCISKVLLARLKSARERLSLPNRYVDSQPGFLNLDEGR